MRLPKSSELSMVSWAYAVLNPREEPPGWNLPPRSGKISDTSSPTGAPKNRFVGDDVVTFEKWDDNTEENNVQEQTIHSNSTVDDLFDLIASTLIDNDDML